MVTREPEWDDPQRDAMLGLKIHDAGICSGCGFHYSIADDMEHNHIDVEEHVCALCKSVAPYGRALAESDQEFERKLDDKAPPETPRPSDGRRVTMRLLSPIEVEAREKP